jgi:hypothetical protein
MILQSRRVRKAEATPKHQIHRSYSCHLRFSCLEERTASHVLNALLPKKEFVVKQLGGAVIFCMKVVVRKEVSGD